MVRYTLLRLLIFFGFTLLFWLVGLRHDPLVLVILAALASSVTSYVLLRGMRDEMTAKLMARHEARVAARNAAVSEDELAEDAEAEAAAEAEGADAAAGPEEARAREVAQVREVREVAEVPEAADRRRRQPRDEPA